MKTMPTNLKRIAQVIGAISFAMVTTVAIDQSEWSYLNVVSAAVAAEDGHAGHQAGKGTKGGAGAKQGGSMGGPQGASGKGSKALENSVLKPKVDDDSDRPPWAGVKGGKAGAGGKPPGAGVMKGDLYGDLFVLIRDPVTGLAKTDAAGLPLVQAFTLDGVLLTGVSIPRDAEGNLLIDPNTGTYTFPDGTVVTTKEVEFGRLSVGRAPSKVIEHSLTEALTKLVAASASDTDSIVIAQDAAGRLVIVTDGVAKAIDSPLENLALYQAIANLTGTDRTISDGTNTWTVPTSINIDLLKASLLAAAADKTGTITLDTVMYINPILGVQDALGSVSYDRETTYKDAYVTVLVPNADGTVWTAKSISVYDAVFKSTNVTVLPGATDFAQAANDALQVIEFIHEYAVPVMPVTAP